jgi:8-oxo-dGTP diphosphatase
LTQAGEPIHVVAGILRDAAGQVLLTQRPSGKHLAGSWEFPGGKVDAGESAQDALRRELHEELGIEAGALEPVIGVPWRYAQKSIFLDVYRALDYAGSPHGREGQALCWCRLEELSARNMPPADRPVVAALRLPPFYAITPEPDPDDAAFLERIDRVLAEGARLLQLRAKSHTPERLRGLACEVHRRARKAGAQLLLNGDVLMATDLGLDGVHMPARELMRLRARPVPADRWFAASCHDASELAHAAAVGVDFAVLAPVKTTSSHPNAPALGWQTFSTLTAQAPFPVYALGGLARGDRTTAVAAGAQGIAGISAFFG